VERRGSDSRSRENPLFSAPELSYLGKRAEDIQQSCLSLAETRLFGSSLEIASNSIPWEMRIEISGVTCGILD
jgi:hypothetical protein